VKASTKGDGERDHAAPDAVKTPLPLSKQCWIKPTMFAPKGTKMKPLKIDCADENWKSLLKRNLQEGIEVTLDNFSYTADGQFCELLAISHSMSFRLDVRNKAGHFTKRPSAT
jgi:hypothetical protein